MKINEQNNFEIDGDRINIKTDSEREAIKIEFFVGGDRALPGCVPPMVPLSVPVVDAQCVVLRAGRGDSEVDNALGTGVTDKQFP